MECLSIIRWKPQTLSDVLGIQPARIGNWLDGTGIIPTKVASWLEALCFTHEAAELLKPAMGEHGKVAAHTSTARPEHIPVYSYHLLRRLGEGPVSLTTLFGTDDEGAVFFLVTRQLAERIGQDLVITTLGKNVGELSGEKLEVPKAKRAG
jgi:hypothetical protein